MHATLRQLLSLRDGLPVDAECQAHVAACDTCQRELGHLRDVTHALRALPDPRAPEGAWAAVRARLTARGAGAPVAGRGGPPSPAAVGAGESGLPVPATGEAPSPAAGPGFSLGVGRGAGADRGRGDRTRTGRPTGERPHGPPGPRRLARGGTLVGVLAGLAVLGLRGLSDRLPENMVGVPPTTRAEMLGPFSSIAESTLPLARRPGFDQLLSKFHAQEAELARRRYGALPAGSEAPLSPRALALEERIARLDHYRLLHKDLSPAREHQLMLQRVALMDSLLLEYGAEPPLRAIPASYPEPF